jgi:putative metalloprotease
LDGDGSSGNSLQLPLRALDQRRSCAHIIDMLKFLPILLAILYGLAMYRLSAWRTARELNSRSTELADPALKRLTDQMADALDLKRIKVHIYEIDPVNGLAAPDGRIFITRGFYRKYRNGEVSAEELSSVIAHELGHVALGHSRRRMIDFSGQNALRTALAMILGRFIPGFGVMIANSIATVLAARLSRGDEYEADAYASALLVKANIGTEAQKSLFRKLEDLTQSRAGAVPAWLLSHPKTTDRIKAIEANERKWSAVTVD